MKRKKKLICQRIYEENKERVRWFLAKRFPDLGKDDIFDVMQEVWKILTENIEEVNKKEEDGQCGWLLTVARNEAYGKIRERQREQNLIERVQVEAPPRPSDSAQDIVLGKMMASSILEKLSSNEKETLFGTYFDVSPSGITENMNNAEVCKRYRARVKLKKYMKEGGLDE